MRKLIILLAALMLTMSGVALANHTPQFGIGATVNGAKPFGPNGVTYVRNLPSGARWLDGDRYGYRCAYTFLEWQGELVARVTFVRVDEAAAYARIFDDRMHEGLRDYDGTRGNGTQTGSPGDCPSSAGYASQSEPAPRPVITFDDGVTLETRDYNGLPVIPGFTFAITSHGTDCGRELALECVNVVAYQNGVPAVAVYYDRISDSITLGSNFVSPPITGAAQVLMSDGSFADVGLSVTLGERSCGTGIITLGDGREVETTVCT